jgi:hypothetical protein
MKNKKISIAIILAILLSFSMIPNFAKSASADPVGYWSFDEGSGTVAHDSSGNGHDGVVNGASWVDGAINKALQFDGVNDYVEISYSSDLNPKSLTISHWVYFNSFPASYGSNPNSETIAQGTNDQVNGFYGLGQIHYPPVIQFALRENNQYYLVSSTTQIAVGQWYHVVGTYDGSAMKLYINGTLENQKTIDVQRTTNNANLQIGAQRQSGFEYWFDGIIDEVKIYNYARTAEQIQSDYTSLVSSTTPSPSATTGSNQPIDLWLILSVVGVSIIAVSVIAVAVHRRKKQTAPRATNVLPTKPVAAEQDVCPNCGAKFPAGSKFCGKCGTALK